MGNEYTQTWLRSFVIIALLICCCFNANAAFYVKKAALVQPAFGPVVSGPAQITPIPHGGRVKPTHFNAPAPDDGYKGILALIFGGSSILMLLVAFIAPSVIGLIVPAFFVGVAGIVFGAMRKKQNKALGRAGLVMGIIGVAAILLFTIAVLIALASFT